MFQWMRRVSFVLLAAVLAAIAVSCVPAKPEEPKLKLALIPVLDTIPIFIAQQNGYFAEAGIEVEANRTILHPEALGAVAPSFPPDAVQEISFQQRSEERLRHVPVHQHGVERVAHRWPLYLGVMNNGNRGRQPAASVKEKMTDSDPAGDDWNGGVLNQSQHGLVFERACHDHIHIT